MKAAKCAGFRFEGARKGNSKMCRVQGSGDGEHASETATGSGLRVEGQASETATSAGSGVAGGQASETATGSGLRVEGAGK